MKRLDEVALQEKVSRAELIGRAVSMYLVRPRRVTDHSAFEIWKHRQIDALEHQRAMRQEWSRRDET